MPYKIQYSPETTQRYPTINVSRQVKWGRWIVAIMLIGGSIWIRFKGVPDFMIPGDPDITKSAVEMMVSNLRAGVNLADALTAFCQEILDGALY